MSKPIFNGIIVFVLFLVVVLGWAATTTRTRMTTRTMDDG
jgi:hypothetical protein